MKKTGKCKLTGEIGAFAKSHVIPNALTKPTLPDIPFWQAGEGSMPIKRWSGWYDRRIVTNSGEKILAEIDNEGIKRLRSLGFLWEGKITSKQMIFDEEFSLGANGQSIGLIKNFPKEDAEILRLFFLSVLWRCAVSHLPEMRKIKLTIGQERKLRQAILSRNVEPSYFLPICLVKFTTASFRHNRTPLSHTKIIDYGNRIEKVRIFRLYFDGLCCHFHRDLNRAQWKGMGSMCLGSGESLAVLTMPFESSREFEVLEWEKLDLKKAKDSSFLTF